VVVSMARLAEMVETHKKESEARMEGARRRPLRGRRRVTRSMTRGGTSAAFSMLSTDAIVDKHLADCKN